MARPALAATRALDILNFLAAHPTEAFTLSDLVQRLEINVASSHAILRVLTDAGYLARHARHRTYTLGPALVAVGTAALEKHPAIDLARDEARHLVSQLGVDVAVTAPVGDEIVFVARSGSHQPRGMPTYVGQRMPLRPPIGSIFLAWSTEADIRAWLARAAGSPTPNEIESYRNVLADVRERGYSVGLEVESRRGLGRVLEDLADHPTVDRRAAAIEGLLGELAQSHYQVGEIDPDASYDISSIAGAVFDEGGRVALAINLVGVPAHLTGREVRRYGEAARDAGLVVTKRTRGRAPS